MRHPCLKGFTQHSRVSAGFTLIELLIVIAIIGILAAVILASLNAARNKGNDGAVTTDIRGVTDQAEIYYTDNNNYGTNSADESDCAATDNLFADAHISAQVAAANTANANGSVTCNVAADGTGYAVSAELLQTPGSYYCVDNVPSARTTTIALGTNTVCP